MKKQEKLIMLNIIFVTSLVMANVLALLDTPFFYFLTKETEKDEGEK